MKTSKKQKINLEQFKQEKKVGQVIKPINFYKSQIDWVEKNKITNLSGFIRSILDQFIKDNT